MPMRGQLEVLKEHFDRGGSLSVAEALSLYGVYALSQRCGELRRMDYPVTSEWETTRTGKRIARYRKLMIAYG